MYGNTVIIAVTLAIGGNGSKMAYFSHSAGTAHGAPSESPKSLSHCYLDPPHAGCSLRLVQHIAGLSSLKHLRHFGTPQPKLSGR